MSESLPFAPFIHPSEDAALAALRSIGGDLCPDFSTTIQHPQLGTIQRHFAILGNLLKPGIRVQNKAVLERIKPLLDDPDNERTKTKLIKGRLSYTPVNKRLLRKLTLVFHQGGVHLPWTFRPMNFDFAALLANVHEQEPVKFLTFYNQTVRFFGQGDAATVELGRLFSLPVEGHAQGTWAEMMSDDMLDEDIALILEANAR